MTRQVLAVQELLHQKGRAAIVAAYVQHIDHVRVTDEICSTSLAQKPGNNLRILRVLVAQHLDGDFPPHLDVERAPYLSHAARAEELLEHVLAREELPLACRAAPCRTGDHPQSISREALVARARVGVCSPPDDNEAPSDHTPGPLATLAAHALIGLLATMSMACDESKDDKSKSAPEAAAPAAAASGAPSASAAAAPTPTASATWQKKSPADCKPHPATVDFDDARLESEVRRKLGKDAGRITPADLAQIKSINLSTARLHQIDPCVFPMFASLKDLFLGPGDYDDLTPIQKLTTLETLRVSMSQVKDLHAIEGLKRMDRLDLSHTLVGDEELKSVGSLVNLTELTLDESAITDITPLANLKKLEKLSVKKTQVKSLAPLAMLKALKFVYIADTQVSDITPVQPLISGGMKLVQN